MLRWKTKGFLFLNKRPVIKIFSPVIKNVTSDSDTDRNNKHVARWARQAIGARYTITTRKTLQQIHSIYMFRI